MKKFLFLPVCIVLMACQTSAVASLNKEQIESQKAFLSEAIADTPYAAVVKHTSVEVIDSAEDEFNSKHIFYADVIETIRGEEHQNIRYTMLVERGEEAILDKTPVIITLCSDDGYYWPGTGAQFSANQPFLQAAKQGALKTNTEQSYFSHCD